MARRTGRRVEGQDVYIAFHHYYGTTVYLDCVGIVSPYAYEPVFYDTQYVSMIEPGGHSYVQFDAWTALTGDYSINVSARLTGDLYPDNDYLVVTVTGEVAIPEFSALLVPVLGVIVVMLAHRRVGRKG